MVVNELELHWRGSALRSADWTESQNLSINASPFVIVIGKNFNYTCFAASLE